MRNSRQGDLRRLMTSRRDGNILSFAKHSGILVTRPLVLHGGPPLERMRESGGAAELFT